jgi:predicted nucleic acid-binding protein
MTRLVADASAIVDVLSGAQHAAAIRSELSAVAELDVPEHFHVEAMSALRGLLRRGDMSPERADRALDLLLSLRVVRHAVAPLARDVWALRMAVTAYDAAYLALARALDARVLTTDSGLAAGARSDRRLVELQL